MKIHKVVLSWRDVLQHRRRDSQNYHDKSGIQGRGRTFACDAEILNLTWDRRHRLQEHADGDRHNK